MLSVLSKNKRKFNENYKHSANNPCISHIQLFEFDSEASEIHRVSTLILFVQRNKWNELRAKSREEEKKNERIDKISKKMFGFVVVGSVFRAPFFLSIYNVALLAWIDGIRSQSTRCYWESRANHAVIREKKYVGPNIRVGSCNARLIAYVFVSLAYVCVRCCNGWHRAAFFRFVSSVFFILVCAHLVGGYSLVI